MQDYSLLPQKQKLSMDFFLICLLTLGNNLSLKVAYPPSRFKMVTVKSFYVGDYLFDAYLSEHVGIVQKVSVLVIFSEMWKFSLSR